MSETDLNAEAKNQKRKYSKLTTASGICFILYLVLSLTSFGLLSFSETKACQALEVLLWGLLIAAPILGVGGLISVLVSKGRLRGISASLVFTLVPVLWLSWAFGMAHGASLARRTSCAKNLSALGKAVMAYSIDWDEEQERWSQWCDMLHEAGVPLGTFDCLADKQGPSSYALNKYAAQSDRLDMSADIVLLFESRPGWNQVGGPELLSMENHEGEGCNILFNDGSVKFVKTEQLGDLKWEDEKAKK